MCAGSITHVHDHPHFSNKWKEENKDEGMIWLNCVFIFWGCLTGTVQPDSVLTSNDSTFTSTLQFHLSFPFCHFFHYRHLSWLSQLSLRLCCAAFLNVAKERILMSTEMPWILTAEVYCPTGEVTLDWSSGKVASGSSIMYLAFSQRSRF